MAVSSGVHSCKETPSGLAYSAKFRKSRHCGPQSNLARSVTTNCLHLRKTYIYIIGNALQPEAGTAAWNEELWLHLSLRGYTLLGSGKAFPCPARMVLESWPLNKFSQMLLARIMHSETVERSRSHLPMTGTMILRAFGFNACYLFQTPSGQGGPANISEPPCHQPGPTPAASVPYCSRKLQSY